MSDSIPELKAKCTILESEVATLRESLQRLKADTQKLLDSSEASRKKWLRVWSVVLGMAVVVGYIGLNFYNSAKDTLNQAVEDTKRQNEQARADLSAYAEGTLKPALRQSVDTNLERASLSLNKLTSLASKLNYDDTEGTLVVTCNSLQVRPLNSKAQSAGTRIVLGFENNPHRGFNAAELPMPGPGRGEVPHLQPVFDAYLANDRVLTCNFGTEPSITLKALGLPKTFSPESPIVVEQVLLLAPHSVSIAEHVWDKDAQRVTNPFGSMPGFLATRSSFLGLGLCAHTLRRRTGRNAGDPMHAYSLEMGLAANGAPYVDSRVRDEKGNLTHEHKVPFK